MKQESDEKAYEAVLIGGMLEAWLPIPAIRAEDESLKKKYPNMKKCAEVYEVQDQSVDFLFQIDQDVQVSNGSVENLKKSVREIIMRLQPSNTFYGDSTETTENMMVQWFDFDSYGLDGMIYNLIFFTTVGGFMCSGSFHCEACNAVDWKPVFLRVLKSFRDMEVCDES